MRLFALFLTLVFLGVAAWLGQGLWQRMQRPAAGPAPLLAAPLVTAAAAPGQPVVRRRWPPLFGTPLVVEPQPPAPVQPAPPPAPPLPPIESLGYRLKGMVRNGAATWAIVTHPSGDLLLKVGDSLGDSLGAELVVDSIDEEGLWLSRAGQRLLLGFETQLP